MIKETTEKVIRLPRTWIIGSMAIVIAMLGGLSAASVAQANTGHSSKAATCNAADLKMVYPSTPTQDGNATRFDHVKQVGDTIQVAYTVSAHNLADCKGYLVEFKSNFRPDGTPGGGPDASASVKRAVMASDTLSLPIPAPMLVKGVCNTFVQFDFVLLRPNGQPVVRNHPLAGVRLKLKGDCKVTTPPSTPSTHTTPPPTKTTVHTTPPAVTPVTHTTQTFPVAAHTGGSGVAFWQQPINWLLLAGGIAGLFVAFGPFGVRARRARHSRRH